eukprot:5498282-Pyramimonas_sp.AAC.1
MSTGIADTYTSACTRGPGGRRAGSALHMDGVSSACSRPISEKLGGESNSPVVVWLNKGLMAVWSPTRLAVGADHAKPLDRVVGIELDGFKGAVHPHLPSPRLDVLLKQAEGQRSHPQYIGQSEEDALGPQPRVPNEKKGRRVVHRYSDPPQAARFPSNGIPGSHFVSIHNLGG